MSLYGSIEVDIERFYSNDESELSGNGPNQWIKNPIVVKSRLVMYDIEVMV